MIDAHSTIIGSVVTVENVVVGAESILTRDVPSNSFVTGINNVRQ